jgi:hypothetical protein
MAAGAIVGSIILAVLALFRKGEKAGRADVQLKQAQAVQKAQEKANVAQSEVSQKPDGQAAKELEDKWTR